MRNLTKLYVNQILNGDITINDVPMKLQEEVKKELEKLNTEKSK